ncbi:transglycosylase domain-containing protein [Deinococcus misasensis]|uniref:transglycosylase domain-containing protein n=1 Tax=Deinococcus misasensis TaxID=392413 RepID=UPI00068CA0C8|nr:transglycosylase domain-containing protein [Deinococcus misasensis]
MPRLNLVLRVMLYVFFALIALFALILLSWQPEIRRVHTVKQLEYAGKATILDQNGEVLAALSPTLSSGARVSRQVLGTDGFSPWLRKSVVASEDERFFMHAGIDWRGLGRAVFSTLRGDPQGGSTLTQQVVKNTLLSEMQGARNPTRKLKEALMALKVEKKFSKVEILTAYLNVVYWGVGRTDLMGAEDAALVYFRKHARDLNLAESVYLTTLLPNPRRYLDYPSYRPLMKNLLDRMVESRMVTPQEALEAWRFPLKPAGWSVRYDEQGNLLEATLVNPDARKQNSPAPRVRFADGFLDQVERELLERFSKSLLYQSDVSVLTTLNVQAQRSAERASIEANLPEGTTLGIALLNPKNGDVKALVGQKLGDGLLEEWNHATRSKRQVGSSIKPLLYTFALTRGFTLHSTVLDLPLKGEYQPQNFNGRYSGKAVTFQDALDHSLNLPAVHLLDQIGVDPFASKLQQLGLQADPRAGLPLAIGAVEASPLEMAAAYAPYANAGTFFKPRVIQKVLQGERVLWDNQKPEAKQVWDERTAFEGLNLLRGFVSDLTPAQGGLGWKARIPGWQVGGKTGTTNDVKDLWFVGITPELAGAVWIGRSDNAPLPSNLFSGDVAAPLWQKAMAGALNGRKITAFESPEEIKAQAASRGPEVVRSALPQAQNTKPVSTEAIQKTTPATKNKNQQATLYARQDKERKVFQQKEDRLLALQAKARGSVEQERQNLLESQQTEQNRLKLKMANLVRQQQVDATLQKVRIAATLSKEQKALETRKYDRLLQTQKQQRITVQREISLLNQKQKSQRVALLQKEGRLLTLQKRERIQLREQEMALLSAQKKERVRLLQTQAQL